MSFTFFNRKTKKNNDPKIAFYLQAIHHGEHGILNATSKKHDFQDKDISFAIIGISNPPPITPDILEMIWTEAKEQGFIPHYIVRYDGGKGIGEVLGRSTQEANLFAVPNHLRDLTKEAKENA